jgi:BMFP domain-containing protein YqiC
MAGRKRQAGLLRRHSGELPDSVGTEHGLEIRQQHVGAAGRREECVMAQNRLLDDVARLFTDAAGMAQGVRREAEGVVRAQFERMIRDMDVVSREEFEAVREMAILARDENERLAERIAALEARLAAASRSDASAD